MHTRLVAIALVFCACSVTPSGPLPTTFGGAGSDADGAASLLTALTDVASLADCPNGGFLLDFGFDVNRNNALDPTEVAGQEVICHGKDGVAGTAGAPGPKGSDGGPGQPGEPGADGSSGGAGPAGQAGPSGANCWEDVGDYNGDGTEDSWDCVWAALCPGPPDEVPDADGDGDITLADCRELLRGPPGIAGPGGGDGGGDLPNEDWDGDGVVNADDNCLFVSNEDQADLDLDGHGDDCDPDRDGDGFANDDECWPDLAHLHPGAAAAGDDATCDGLDDDCDGAVDEGFVEQPCQDPDLEGVCSEGATLCINGVATCVLGRPDEEVCDGLDNDCDGQADEDDGQGECGPPPCADHEDWIPVNCQTGEWVWSSDRARAVNLEDANRLRVLWTNHGDNAMCSLDGAGWVSSEIFRIRDCNSDWYHIGGRYTGNCGGHDGEITRLLALGPDDCWDYRGEDLP